MTTYTLAETATRVLRDAGLVAPDETPTSEDIEWAEETITATFATLQAKGINFWNSDAAILDESYLIPLSQRVQLGFGPSFGIMSMPEAVAAIIPVERELRIMSEPAPTGENTRDVYF